MLSINSRVLEKLFIAVWISLHRVFCRKLKMTWCEEAHCNIGENVTEGHQHIQSYLWTQTSIKGCLCIGSGSIYFVDVLFQQERNSLSAAAKVPSVPTVTNATFQPSPPLHLKVYQLFICCTLKRSVMQLSGNYGERLMCMMAATCCDKHSHQLR